MGNNKLSPKAILGDLTQLQDAAKALNDAVKLIGDNRQRLEVVESAVLRIDRQLESLERRYSELLFILGDIKRR